MLITNILTILFSLFLTLENTTNKILIKDTLIIETLTLSKEELINIIIDNYNIPNNYDNVEINTNYLNSPEYNKIYSVILTVQYNDEIINYNLKLKTINPKSKNTDNDSIIIISLITLILFSCLFILNVLINQNINFYF